MKKQYILHLVLSQCIIFIFPFVTVNAQGWEKTYNGLGSADGHTVQQTADGGYIIIASTKAAGLKSLAYLIKTDPNGDTLWTKAYKGASLNTYGRYGHQTADGGYIIAGHTESSPGSNVSGYLIKTDPLGDTLWTKSYVDYVNSVQQTTDGGYVVAVSTNVGSYLIKTDTNGNTLWSKTYGNNSDVFRSVRQTTDGGYIIAGVTSSFGAGIQDVYLLRTNMNGDSLWAKAYGGSYDRCRIFRTANY
ncbi:MAG: hypothetical protein JKY52_06330 [Flavobacteriales bacterium]|nr:hypothetical protein [Flavobacteriales bacterium]